MSDNAAQAATGRVKNFMREFKEFAMKGNVVDMAIGVIIGGAFGKIVSSLVNDIIMPGLSKVTGGASFADLKYELTPASEGVDAVTLNYGMFIQNIVDFVIIALCIFVAIKVMLSFNRKKKEEEAAAPAPEPSDEAKLLAEIRDSLKQLNNKHNA